MEEFAAMVGDLMVKYPAFSKFAMVLGMVRLFMKPVCSFVSAVVEITPSKKDDDFWKKVKESKPFKWSMYCLDWFTSIKVKK